MAALKLLLSSARRHCLSNPHSHLHPPPFLSYRRSLSSESDPTQNPNRNSPSPQPPTRQSVQIEPVSYSLKPKDHSSPDPDPTSQPEQTAPPPPSGPQDLPNSPSQETRSEWTREEARFLRHVPSISPVSYRGPGGGRGVETGAEKGGESVKDHEADLEREKKRIQADGRLRRRLFRVPEEEVVVPFPTLINVEKKERKPILDVMDAIRQVKANARCKFDETVEAHVQLGIDAKRNAVRGNMTLPHGSGKVVKVAFFAEGADAEEAKAAGADIVGGVELVEEIASTKLNVDKCFATNEMIMRLALRILRERGLMPDRKLGTVTNDISGALQKVRQGHIEYRMDRTSIVHVGLGKVSFTEEYLRENIGAFMSSLLLAKPTGLKKSSKYAGYINSFHICSTMGPGVPVSIQSLSKAADHYNKMHLK
ncbi:50S ribosomal protein L1 chloroplastic [Prunus yedoensis var. nudiflora]|uniref:CL1 n=1 Tax=Prunus yedoensis var. nudiflora TaxID=2094558 RepID=A0A314ZK76_PRUYE|nr:50S ribosomal protein L1 chloroplastic [Prunus yedoensis var. nudiflora]